MGKITGFMEFERDTPKRRPVEERLRDFAELELPAGSERLNAQAARCMDCGVPFCHNGCPLGNIIPDWNDLVYHNDMQRAIDALHATNNFPEFTGRICPAPCEEACVLNINDDPVTIKLIERSIIDEAWQKGWVKPQVSTHKTGKKVAVIGSGPSGMACAQQLARAGHEVTLFERADRIGGLLRYGIPDFKMEKHLIDRRVEQMRAEGVTIRTGVNVGKDIGADQLTSDYDAVALCMGATNSRDLPVEGRQLDGVHFAMEFLPQQNKRNAGDTIDPADSITAADKHVVVIGGGDTGSDCIGTSNRQGAKSVTQIEILPEPPEARTEDMPWPYWPMIYRTSSSQEEGVTRDFAITTTHLSGEDGKVKTLHGARVEWKIGDTGRPQMQQIEGSEFELPADLVLLAMGFLGPQHEGLLNDLGVEYDERGSIKCEQSYASSIPGIFACGDARRGQSLVVWAIWEGRECARTVDAYLVGESRLSTTPQLD